MSKWTTEKWEEWRYGRALAKEDKLQRDTWNRRFPIATFRDRGPSKAERNDENYWLKDSKRAKLTKQIEEWTEQGRTPLEILKLRQEWRERDYEGMCSAG